MPISGLWDEGFFDPDINPQGPEAAYFGRQGQWGTPNLKKYFQGQFSNIQNQYLGQLGSMVYGGQAPNLTFSDWLSKYNWKQQFQGLPPGERGADSSRFSPFTRWMTNR